MWSPLSGNHRGLVHRPTTFRPVGSLACRRRFGLSIWREYYRKGAPVAEGHTTGPSRQVHLAPPDELVSALHGLKGSVEAAGGAAAGSQLKSEATQWAQQQAGPVARGLDPTRVFQQPDLQAVLSLLKSLPPQQLGGGALAAALLCVDKWRGRQLKHGPAAEGGAEEAAAQTIVQLGWQQLSSLPAGALVPLLLATLSVTVPTKTLVVAWVSAMQACNGVRELYPGDRAGLLDAAHKLATKSGGGLYLPRGMLTGNLVKLGTSDRAARLSLRQLALVWVAIHGLGLRLTSQQQHVLASALVQHLGPDKPASGVALTQILTTWVDMEPLHVAWKAKQGSNNKPRLSRQQSGPVGEVQPSGNTPMGQQHQQQHQQAQRADQHKQEGVLPPATWQAKGGGRQEQSQQAWQREGQEWRGQGRRQQQDAAHSESGLALGRHFTTEALEADEIEDVVALQDGTMCRPPSGYPGHRVLSAIVLYCHEHREELGSWPLGQLLGALGALRHAPPPAILADLVEAFRSKLQGPEQARELTAALTGLARLDCDPGEAFCKTCFQIAMADDGADQLLLASVAWGLAMFKRCTPGQWAMLLALYGTPSPPSPSAGDSSTEFEPRPHLPPRWLTAYTLMLEQYGCLPSRVEDVGDTVTGAGHAAPSIAVKGAADSGMPGAAAGQGVARLPDGLLHRGLLLQQQLLERDRPAQAVRRRTLYPATLEALRQLCAGRYKVEEHFLVQDPQSSATMLLDLAVPELRFGVRIGQSSDLVRTTGLPLGHVTLLQRLGRLTGWEVALLPPPKLLVRPDAPPEERLAAASAFLLKEGGLQQLLAAGRP